MTRFTPRRHAAAGDPTRTTVDISDQISDADLEERVDQLRGYPRLTQHQVDDLADYEQELANRHRARDRARLARAVDPATGRVRPGHGVGVADQQARNTEQALGRPTVDEPRGSGPRSEARRVIERAEGDGLIPAEAAERASRLVTDGPEHGQTIAARWAVVCGDPAYRTAFAKKLAMGDDARDAWTDVERGAWSRVLALQAEWRAMGLTDGAGGYMVPLTLDPAILLTNDGTINPLRQLARVEQIATDTWNGVSSAGASAEWLAPSVEAADGSPTVAQPTVKPEKGAAFVPFSFEIGDDAANFLGELQKVLVDEAGVLQSAAFTTGDGTDKPFGIVTGATETVDTATAATFATDDVYQLQEALPPRFQADAVWLANLAVINSIDLFETGNGAKMFPQVGEAESVLLRKRLWEVSDMASTPATTGAKTLLYGDVRRGFLIADRIGSTFEIIPHLMGANRRPSGERGGLLWFRTGSKVIVPEALRLLVVA